MVWCASFLALAGLDLSAVRVELVTGRADLALREGVVTLVGRSQAQSIDGPAYLETGPASSVAVRWRSEASCELRGVNALEWRSPRDGRGVFVSAWRVSELDFEVRRGPLRLDLGGGWRVELAVGAASLRTLADGRIELRHVAGSPLALHRAADAGCVSPPWTLLPGAQVRLDPQAALGVVDAPRARRALPPPPPGPQSVAPAPAWNGFAWPWAPRERAIPPASHAPSERAAPARIESSRIAPAASERPAAAAPLDLPERRASATSKDASALDASANDASAQGSSANDSSVNGASSNDASAWHDSANGAGKRGSDADDSSANDASSNDTRASSQAATTAPRVVAHEGLSSVAASIPASEVAQAHGDEARAQAAFDASLYPPLRRRGALVLTPFGPRWADRP